MSEPGSEAYLVTVIDSESRRIPLEAGEVWHIGRGEPNSIPLADHQVSRKHAMVQRAQTGEFQLIDMGSRNGTFVNRRRVTTPVILRPGDRITIGGAEFVFYGPSEPAQAPAPGASETVVEFAQQLVTVLVVDIRDFTGLSRRLSENKLSLLISAFFRECGAVLNRHEAFAQKYIGDAVMALWPHPEKGPEPRQMHAVFSALAQMFDVAAGLQAQFDLDAPIRIGAGINTGLACIGNMGSEAAADYTALSDAVNLSFRLEAATKEIGCDLAVGPKTYNFLTALAGAAGIFTPHTASLKGYEHPMQVYAATRASLGVLVGALRAGSESQLTMIHGPE